MNAVVSKPKEVLIPDQLPVGRTPTIAWWLTLAGTLALPITADLVLRAPAEAAGLGLLVLGGFFLFEERGRRSLVGLVLLLAATLVAPLVAWPAAIAAISKRSFGRHRFFTSGCLLLSAIIAALLRPEIRAGAVDLAEHLAEKGLAAVLLVQESILGGLLPWRTPVLGIHPHDDPIPGLAILAATLFLPTVLLQGRAPALRKAAPWRGLLFGFSLGILGLATATLLGRPVLGHGALAASCTLALVVHVAAAILARVGLRPFWSRCIFVATCAVVAVVTIPASLDRWRLGGDILPVSQAVILEDPVSSLRLDLARHLFETGDQDAYFREGETYFRHHRHACARTRSFALDCLDQGRRDQALVHLKTCGKEALPSEPKDRSRVLAFIEQSSAQELFVAVAESQAKGDPELELQLSQAYQRLGKDEESLRHLDAAVASERPPLRALELKFRRLSRAQDIGALEKFGFRVLALYPQSALGDQALGRAAKIVRDDDKMIEHDERALAKNDQLAEVHYDLALVRHGRTGEEAKAAAHYRRVLDLIPDHPRKSVIEDWISSLTPQATEPGEPGLGGN